MLDMDSLQDMRLKIAVQTYGGQNWGGITELVPGRTQMQCWSRWHDRRAQVSADHTSTIDMLPKQGSRTGPWSPDEDAQLTDAVQKHGLKNWDAITDQVPGRTRIQCNYRWRHVLDDNFGAAPKRKGKWTVAERVQLKEA
jgi:hypothetical protein